MSQATIDVLTSAAFLTGILAGAVALALAWLAYFMFDTGGRPLRVAGIVLAAAGIVAIGATGTISAATVLGIALLAVAGLLPLPTLLSAALALPGAIVLALETGLDDPAVTWFLVIGILVAAPLVASFDRTYADHALPIPMYALAVVGLFFTVPDTEIAVVLLGTMVAGVFLGWPKPFFALGAGGSYALVGLFVWVAAAGGAARPASIIVASGCLGLLLAEPVGRWLSHRGGTLLSDGRIEETALLLLQLLVVFVIARGVGRVSSTWMATVLTLFVLGAAAVGVALRTREPARRPERAEP